MAALDLKLKIGSALNPTTRIVSKQSTPRAELKALNITFNDGDVTLNGRMLGTKELDSTFETLGASDNDFLVVNSKQKSGGRA